MQKALVLAKTESVKNIKEKTRKRKNSKLLFKLITIIIIVILIAFIINTISLKQKYSFTDPITGIEFKSKNFHIHDAFEIFSQDDNYLIVFNTLYNDQDHLTNITESVIYVQSMLSAKNKDTILLISVSDENRNLITCQSNLGDVYENVELSTEDCLDLIYSELSVILVDYPYPEIIDSNVEINLVNKIVKIRAKDKTDIYFSLVLLVNEMFDDAPLTEENIKLINERIQEIQEQEEKQ